MNPHNIPIDAKKWYPVEYIVTKKLIPGCTRMEYIKYYMSIGKIPYEVLQTARTSEPKYIVKGEHILLLQKLYEYGYALKKKSSPPPMLISRIFQDVMTTQHTLRTYP